MPRRKRESGTHLADAGAETKQLERRLRWLLMPAIDPPELMDAICASLSKESDRTKGRPLGERVAALEAFRAEKNREGWKPEHVAAEQARRPDNKYVTRNGGIAPRPR